MQHWEGCEVCRKTCIIALALPDDNFKQSRQHAVVFMSNGEYNVVQKNNFCIQTKLNYDYVAIDCIPIGQSF